MICFNCKFSDALFVLTILCVVTCFLDVNECANNPCFSSFDCLNLESSYTCLPSVTLDPGSPRVLVNMSGGDLVQFQLSFQNGNYFSSLSDLIDGKYYVSVSYGPSSAPSIFATNSLSLTLHSGSLTSYDCSFQTSAGYGADLAVQLQWTLASNWNLTNASLDGTGYITSGDMFRYPSPSLTSLSLRLNSSTSVSVSDDGNYSYVNIPSSGSSVWLVFSGSNFGEFSDQVSVSYKNSALNGTTFPCVTSPDLTIVNGPVGRFSPSSILCRTATGEPADEYFFTVVVGGQSSSTGLDKLVFPTIPGISSVSGCGSCAGEATHTCSCPTSGGVRITITGSDFGQNMEAYVASLPCLNPILLAFDQLSCDLPAGTGKNVALTVLIRISSSEVLQSPVVYIVSYAAPVVSGVVHISCQQSTDSMLNLVDCPRAGGGTLTITGQNLGIDGAVVLVGSGFCANLMHVSPSTQVNCILPAGIATNVGVIFIQSGGAMSVGEVTISYVQCAAGTYQSGVEQICQPCPPGSITATSGLFACSVCPSGTKSNTHLDSCTDCLAGQMSEAGSTVCVDCPAGSVSPSFRSPSCLNCPAGTFQNVSGATSCENCPYGKFEALQGSRFCSSCLEGSYTSETTTLYACAQCATGRYQSLREATSCEDCTAGKNQNTTGAYSCELCEVGKYSAGVRAVACLLCEAGRTQPLSGQVDCAICVYGKFKNTESTAACSDCVAGKYTSAATTLFVCANCEVGKVQPFEGSTECSLCTEGTYQGSVAQTSCISCAIGTYAAVSGLSSCVTCAIGRYVASTAATACVDCATGRYAVSCY